MRLVVKCHSCGQPIYFSWEADYRYQLPPALTIRCGNIACPTRGQPDYYYPHEVDAVEGFGKAVGGAVALGALGGLIGGPVGAAIGAILGGAAGKADPAETERVRRFNQS